MKAGSAVASRVSEVERAGRRQAESSSSSDDREVAVEGATMHRIGAKRNDRVEITEHGQAENGVDGDIRTKRKRNSDRGARGVDAGSVASDDGSEVTVVSSIEIGGVADLTTVFDGFERVGVAEGNEFSDEIRALGPEPEMKEKKASIEGTAGVREAAELNRGRIGTQIKSNVREAIVDGNRHRRKDGSCGGKVSRKRINLNRAFFREEGRGGAREAEEEE
jgi:hypothetical protein